MTADSQPSVNLIERAKRAFLDASTNVWREIDRLSAEPDGYKGLDASTELRQREREAWETYKNLLDDRR